MTKKTASKKAASKKRAAAASPKANKAKPVKRGRTAKPKATLKSKAKTKSTPRTRTAAKTRLKKSEKRGTRVVAKTRASETNLAAAPQETIAAEPIRKFSSGLSTRDKAQFREMLRAKRAQLVGDVNHMQGEALRTNRQDSAGNLSSMPIHMADIGTDNYEQEFTLGLIEGERALLQEIDAALERLENGTYGLCTATGKPIGKARLKANPWAKYCYEYKLEQEKGMNRRF